MAPNLAVRRELIGAAGLARNLGYGAGTFTAPIWMPAIFNLGQSSSPLTQTVNRIPGMRANPETDIGRRLGNWLSNEARYFANQVSRGQTPYAPNAQQQQPLLARVSAPGTDAGSWRGGAGASGGTSGGGSPAAERAYRQEVSSVAQQAAQNPELQRYEKERAAAAASKDQGKMDAVRDLGMEMWAKANPTLAAKVRPGQSGYDVIQRTLGAGQMGSPMNFGFDASSPLATTPPVAAPSYAGVTPASLPGATPLPSNAFSGMVTTPYDRFNAGQTLTSAPLGMPGAQIPGTYEGATGVQGMGASLGTTPSMFNPSDEKAKALLEAFKNRQFSVQK